MKTLIIEDEPLAADKLMNQLRCLDSEVEFLAVLSSVESTVNWFKRNEPPNLIFMDIQLEDGLCFEIFEEIQIPVPIIFTTAYDKHAIEAFKVNSIDYLLKPVSDHDLKFALDKYKKFHQDSSLVERLSRLQEALQLSQNKYKRRFAVQVGAKLKAIDADEIAFFQVIEKSVYIVNNSGQSFGINHSLEQLEEILDPALFFRINRSTIMGLLSIVEVQQFSASYSKVKLRINNDIDSKISRKRLKEFKLWFEGSLYK